MKLVTNAKVWTGHRLSEQSILIDREGAIAALYGPGVFDPKTVKEVIDAAGLIVLPGGVDMHVHAQDGAETFYECTCAAAAGGITTIIDMPPFHVCSTRPGYLERVELADQECVIDFGQGGGIVVSSSDLEDMEAVAQAGAPYFKLFMPADPPADAELLWDAVQTAARAGLRMAIHMEETACLNTQIDWDDPLAFPNARPAAAEAVATAQVLEMARAAGAPIHVCHVSAGRTVDLIDVYRGWGVDVTAETTPHFLLLDETEFARIGSRVKTTPPLRKAADVELLWQALRDGVIDALACDHFLDELTTPGGKPKSLREKGPGIAGVELALPLLYHAGVHQGRLSLGRFVEVTAERPAEILGLSATKGRIAVGADADLLLIDPEEEYTVANLGSFSRAHTTPYEGWTIQGRVRRTLVRGRTVWNGEEIVAERGWGSYVPSRPAA